MEQSRADLTSTLSRLDGACLGIFGAGHMGRALAAGLLAAGFPTSSLLICHGGSPATRAAIDWAGLSDCVATREEIGLRCRVVLGALRPQDRGAVARLTLSPGSLFISFMAGTPLSSVPVPAGVERARVMPSAPYTISQRRGIAAVFPASHPIAQEICAALGLEAVSVQSEETMHAFTALGPCLPIALAVLGSLGKHADDADLERLGDTHGLRDYGRILSWARSMTPRFATDAERESFIAQAATRGGVTEAIIQAIRGGSSLPDALEAGVQRSRDLDVG